jgi:site-specific recombinase XerD
MTPVGSVVYAFFERHLKAEKGLSPASVKSYRDALRLFLAFVADQHHRQITRLGIEDLTADKVREFLGHTLRSRAATTFVVVTSASPRFTHSSPTWRTKRRRCSPRLSALPRSR